MSMTPRLSGGFLPGYHHLGAQLFVRVGKFSLGRVTDISVQKILT